MGLGAIDAVIFDLDGLLVDSEPLQIAAWEQFLATHGRSLSVGLLSDMFGLRVWDAAALLIERLNLPLTVDEVVNQRDRLFLDAIPGNLHPMPGAQGLIRTLRERGPPIGLATSGHRQYVDVVLSELDLSGVFRVEVTGEQVERGKPAPDIYLAAATGLGVLPGRCLALEDAPHGIASARAAGMQCLAVPNEMTAGLPGFDLANGVLKSLDDVLAWL